MNDHRAAIDKEEEERKFRGDAAIVLEQRVGRINEISKGLLDVTDTEPAEAMWLAARRLRAALDLFRPVLSKAQFSGTRDEVRQLIRVLGHRGVRGDRGGDG